MGLHMKYLAIAAALLFVGNCPLHAQSNVTSTVASVGSASTLNSSGSLNGSGGNSPVVSSPRQGNVAAQNPGEFVPSKFESYDTAVSLGEAARRFRQTTVAEAALKAQQTKTTNPEKPSVVLDKDADGKLIIVQSKR
jgi:hypothetical protein